MLEFSRRSGSATSRRPIASLVAPGVPLIAGRIGAWPRIAASLARTCIAPGLARRILACGIAALALRPPFARPIARTRRRAGFAWAVLAGIARRRIGWWRAPAAPVARPRGSGSRRRARRLLAGGCRGVAGCRFAGRRGHRIGAVERAAGTWRWNRDRGPAAPTPAIAQAQNGPLPPRFFRSGFGAGLAVTGGRRCRACVRRRLYWPTPAPASAPPWRAVIRAGFRRRLVRRGLARIRATSRRYRRGAGRGFRSAGKRRHVARLAPFAGAAGGGLGRVQGGSLDCLCVLCRRVRRQRIEVTPATLASARNQGKRGHSVPAAAG